MNPAILDDMSWAMAEVYAAVTDRILINLAHYFPYVREGAKLPGSFEYQARMLAQMGQVNRETVAIIMQSLGGADEALRGVLERAIVEGLRSEEPALRRAAERGLLTSGVPELTPGMTQAFRSYYRQSADRLNLVNTVMLESTQAAYTATVADIANRIQATQSMLNVAAGEVVTGVSTFNQALHGAVNRMVQNGLTGFVDHAGRHWSPEAYVAMDIRTTTANTARQAVFDRNQEYGNDLYLVSSHDGARPLCYPWQGKIISTTGRRGETTDLDGNTYTIHSEDEIESFRYGGGLFGVNCGHYPMVWIPGFSTMKGQPQDEEANAQQYEESQQQRALERRLREEKRDLEVLKAQGAPEEQIRAQRERVRNANADIDDFCEQTGRARHRDREGAPVRATWPDESTWGDVTQRGTYTPQNVAQQATQPTPQPRTIRGQTDKLAGSMPESDYNEVVRMVDGSPTAPLYETYGDSCKGIVQERNQGYYDSYSDVVHYSFETHDGLNRYTTMSHEMGHMFDQHIGRGNGLTFGEVDFLNSRCVIGSGQHTLFHALPSQSDQFLSAMRLDRDALRAILQDRDALTRMKTGSWRNSTSGIQDAMDGFFSTQDRGLLPWGHGNRYYNRAWNRRVKAFDLEATLRDAMRDYGLGVTNLTQAKQHMREYETASELWANVLAALTCGGPELDAFNEYMPNVVQAVRQIIGGL